MHEKLLTKLLDVRKHNQKSSFPVLVTHKQEVAGGSDPVGGVCIPTVTLWVVFASSSRLSWVSLLGGAMKSLGFLFRNKCNGIYRIFAYIKQWLSEVLTFF